MAVYCVSYDLNRSGQNYNLLYDELKKSSGYIHALDSTWFVSTQETANQLADRIKKVVDSNDSYFVIQVTKNYNGWMPQNVWDWLNKHV